ncbi:MAG: AAA family ATPase [Lachnospiraceae bacterium]|nr:AAA family ATPase [Lachnospiraceae bacterium]
MKTLVKPKLLNMYSSSRETEKITYLKVDEDIGKGSLIKDFKNGAVHFKEAIGFLENKNRSRIVFITSETRELGYMAITYIAAGLNEKNRNDGKTVVVDEDYDSFADACSDPYDKGRELTDGSEPEDPNGHFDDYEYDLEIDDNWKEDPSRIPVIEISLIARFLRMGKREYDYGGYVGDMSADQQRNRPPYWLSCKKEAVCIVCDENELDSLEPEMIDLFKDNRQVYVLISRKSNRESGMYYVDDLYGMSESEILSARNNLVLSFAADELFVTFEESYAPVYYEYVLKQNLKNRMIRTGRGFNYKRIVELAVSLSGTETCTKIDRIIEYALKGRTLKTGITLCNKDFDFVERFKKTIGNAGQKKAVERLNTELVGMDEIKEQVMETVNIMKFNKLRKSMNITGGGFHNVHVMLGAPGTAKTTVATLMGQIMVEEGLLKSNRQICINGAQLKGQYVGQSAPKTKALFDDYDVIIIDEAYSIVDNRGESDSYSNEAIAQLIIELERHSLDKLVIFAGYGGKNVGRKDDRMSLFLNANPGIKSRITSTFIFDSYSAKEVTGIFFNLAKTANYTVDKRTWPIVEEYFEGRIKDSEFGNGREARNLLETAVMFTANRVMSKKKAAYTADEMRRITTEDVVAAVKRLTNSRNDGKARENKTRIGFGTV